jgi:hypothetical protein
VNNFEQIQRLADRREPVVQPTISRMREVALEAHLYGIGGSGTYSDDDGGYGSPGFRSP